MTPRVETAYGSEREGGWAIRCRSFSLSLFDECCESGRRSEPRTTGAHSCSCTSIPGRAFLVIGDSVDLVSNAVHNSSQFSAAMHVIVLNPQTWSSGVKTWLQPRIMHPSARRCLHILVPVKR